ncbi:UxaA family hydrolase [Allopusillimonas ginsengisoli]|uniref:UxaA family hydrolase n=1 Tax=Allopusillimonas ginsengisoli TaxID=453575 RepID=UPI001020A8BA|nr:altronate dehydratase family protein [Allopusillimonas ginsengisoli]TEA77946.1 altronate dehydratase [Allopusillimonas ginsengisoli]
MQRTTIRLNEHDNVIIATTQLMQGNVAEGITISGLIPAGHKIAAQDIPEGSPVRRYNQIIGVATRDIKPGQHVHTHNMKMMAFERDYDFCSHKKDIQINSDADQFMGILRPDGRVATRNFIGILTSVNCSATVAKAIADYFRRDINPDALAAFPNVDGVVALPHATGCGMASSGESMDTLRRTLTGYARQPNFHSVLMIGLGCETNQISGVLAAGKLTENKRLFTYSIQDAGGTAKAVAKGIAKVKEMLAEANQVEREPVSASHLTVGLQCGGSDGYSGITANPALGAAVDRLVRAGGTAILSETPEIYGAEHLLTQRAVSRDVGEKLIKRIKWWEDYCERNRAEMDNNPSAGNKAGGLTTILEKSLGAVAKAGTTNLNDVYEYAEPVVSKGMVFMDSPGFDPVSATGQVASGATLICFTTGRGSAYGCTPSPSLKLSTNNACWERQEEDIDINCGTIITGEETVDSLGEKIYRIMLDTASGKRTKSELHGYGQNEFAPWIIGATM